MSAIDNGTPMPLFDRLGAQGEAYLPDEDALRASIARDLARLLNTRARQPYEAWLAGDGSAIDYGLPDFSARTLRSGADREAIAAAVARAIAWFEPRLVDVAVGFNETDRHANDAVLTIRATMRAGERISHVAFELAGGALSIADPSPDPRNDHG
ncbi:type VI secretion system protein ImpF [Paraburkholderia unamae]|nr:type VI secretion system protein ImpF [Paraburkholderia unamae]